MEEKQLFTNRSLLTLLWPLVVEQLLAVLVGMADVLMVSTLGDAAVSGVSLVDSVNNLVIVIFTAVAAGGTVVCAQFIGARDEGSTRRTAGQLMLITVLAALAVTAVLLIGSRGLLAKMFGTVEPAVMDNALVYLRMTCLSYPFLALYTSGFSLFRAVGNSRISMLVSLSMNLLNILGNAVCIFVLHMGVLGVAIPTVLSRIFASVVTMGLLQRTDRRICISGLQELKPDGEIIRRILGIGIPNSIENGLFQFGKLTLQSLVSTLGTASIAGFAVAGNLVTYLYLPGNALGLGMLTVVGQSIGAGRPQQARQYAKKLVLLNYVMVALIGLGCLLGGKALVGLYHLDPAASLTAQRLLFVHTLAMILWPPAFLLPYYFRARQQTTVTMVIVIFSMWVFRIGGGFFFVRVLHTDVLGVWYAMFLDWFFRFLVFSGWFLRQKRAVST